MGAAGHTRQRRELVAVLLGGAAGVGVVLLGTRLRVAEVIIRAPRPLPATVTPVSAEELRPAIAAMSIAAFASLAAVLATRGLLRRMTGLVTCALGAAMALLAWARVSPAAVAAVAGRAGVSAANDAGAGTAAGSATAGSAAGSAQGTSPASLAGLGSRVLVGGSGWQVLIIAGAALVVAAGIIVVVRSARLPAMSGRYDQPAAAGRAVPLSPASSGPSPINHAGARTRAQPAHENMWDALSAGADPTVGPRRADP